MKNLNLIKPLDLTTVYRKRRGWRNKITDIIKKSSTQTRKWDILQDKLFVIFSTNQKKVRVARTKRQNRARGM